MGVADGGQNRKAAVAAVPIQTNLFGTLARVSERECGHVRLQVRFGSSF
jgi:hypothetical protein